MKIKAYESSYEKGWVRCRVLSFLDTAYFDNVLTNKEMYTNPSIELMAIENEQVVGLIDIEYEIEEGTVCSRGKGLGGMIWHIAVHPDYMRRGIGTKLLQEAERIAKQKGLNRLEAWTRDDRWVNNWYVKNGFQQINSYLHVYLEGEKEIDQMLTMNRSSFHPIQSFVHYTGDDKEGVKKDFKRVHECNCYLKELT